MHTVENIELKKNNMIYNRTELKATIYLILVSLNKEILLIFTQNLKKSWDF